MPRTYSLIVNLVHPFQADLQSRHIESWAQNNTRWYQQTYPWAGWYIMYSNIYCTETKLGILTKKTLWKRILGRRCIRRIRMYMSRESAWTLVQGLMIGRTEYWDSLACRWLLVHICIKGGCLYQMSSTFFWVWKWFSALHWGICGTCSLEQSLYSLRLDEGVLVKDLSLKP